MLPAARGIVAVATEVVCTMTFSSTVKPFMQLKQCRTLKTPKPKMADCKLPMVTQPVCSPKYVFEKQRMLPTHSPVATARTVSWRLGAISSSCLHDLQKRLWLYHTARTAGADNNLFSELTVVSRSH